MNTSLRHIIRSLKLPVKLGLSRRLFNQSLHRDFNALKHSNAISTVIWFAYGYKMEK